MTNLRILRIVSLCVLCVLCAETTVYGAASVSSVVKKYDFTAESAEATETKHVAQTNCDEGVAATSRRAATLACAELNSLRQR